MGTDDNTASEAPTGDDEPLHVTEPVSIQPVVKLVDAVKPVPPKSEGTTQPAQNQPADEIPKTPEPILVRVIEDDALNAFERKTIIVGGLGIFVAFLALVAACVTAYYIHGQLGEMVKQYPELKKSADASERAATASENSIRQNTEAFKLDEQARIRFTLRENGWTPRGDDHPLVANYKYTNVGKTQAEVIAIDKHVALVPFADVGTISFHPTIPIPIGAVGTLYPGDERLTTAFNRSEPISDQDLVLSKKKLIASWGCIKYKDIFGEVHWADFCDVRQPAPDDSVYGACTYQCKRNP
jgi:hypothetical protein